MQSRWRSESCPYRHTADQSRGSRHHIGSHSAGTFGFMVFRCQPTMGRRSVTKRSSAFKSYKWICGAEFHVARKILTAKFPLGSRRKEGLLAGKSLFPVREARRRAGRSTAHQEQLKKMEARNDEVSD